jgi:hypothetical protein
MNIYDGMNMEMSMNPCEYRFPVTNVIKRDGRFLKFDGDTWNRVSALECLKEHFAPVKTKFIKGLRTYDSRDRSRLIRVLRKFEDPIFAKKCLENNLRIPLERRDPEIHFTHGSLSVITGLFRPLDCYDYGRPAVDYDFEEPQPDTWGDFFSRAQTRERADRFRYVVKCWLLSRFEKQTASIWLTGPGKDKLAGLLERVFGHAKKIDERTFADLKFTKSDHGIKIRGISKHKLAIAPINPDVLFEEFPLRAISGMTGTYDPETKTKFRPQHFGFVFVSDKPPNITMYTNYYHTIMNRINYFEVEDFDVSVNICQMLHWIISAADTKKPDMESCYDRPRNHVGVK